LSRCRAAVRKGHGLEEKQRVSEALARVDAQREKLTSQLSELEATERVLARYRQGHSGRKGGVRQDYGDEGGRSSAIRSLGRRGPDKLANRYAPIAR
jgi:hypothetical protein